MQNMQRVMALNDPKVLNVKIVDLPDDRFVRKLILFGVLAVAAAAAVTVLAQEPPQPSSPEKSSERRKNHGDAAFSRRTKRRC